jgi:hypothetical protein
MKIDRPSTSPPSGSASKPSQGGGFSLPAMTTAAPMRPVTPGVAASSVAGVDSILALQTIEDPIHAKRRRQVRRGAGLLDSLDLIRLGHLNGGISKHALETLRVGLNNAESTGDKGLDLLLGEIDVRAAVELAKLERLVV